MQACRHALFGASKPAAILLCSPGVTGPTHGSPLTAVHLRCAVAWLQVPWAVRASVRASAAPAPAATIPPKRRTSAVSPWHKPLSYARSSQTPYVLQSAGTARNVLVWAHDVGQAASWLTCWRWCNIGPAGSSGHCSGDCCSGATDVCVEILDDLGEACCALRCSRALQLPLILAVLGLYLYGISGIRQRHGTQLHQVTHLHLLMSNTVGYHSGCLNAAVHVLCCQALSKPTVACY
jgi:hypothetical protein